MFRISFVILAMASAFALNGCSQCSGQQGEQAPATTEAAPAAPVEAAPAAPAEAAPAAPTEAAPAEVAPAATPAM